MKGTKAEVVRSVMPCLDGLHRHAGLFGLLFYLPTGSFCS